MQAAEKSDAINALQRVAERSDVLSAWQKIAEITTERAPKCGGMVGNVAASFGGGFMAPHRDAKFELDRAAFGFEQLP